MQKNFEKFYENIRLTPAQREDAIIKYKGVCKKLHENYYPNIEYTGTTKLLIGSYGKKTHIRPARDIDVIFIMPDEKFGQYNDNRANCQSQLLQDVKKILEEKYPNTPIKAFGKVVVLEFADTKHNVDLLPAWENEDGTFKIPNSENGGSWEQWNPRKEIKEIKNSNLETGRTKALIRMIKKWSENCSVKLKSYEIENAVLDFFSFYKNIEEDYSITVRDFFEFFYDTIPDDSMKSYIMTALNRAKKACTFADNNEIENSVNEWKKIFGNDFPLAVDKSEKNILDALEEKIKKLNLLYPSEKEEFLGEAYGMETILNPKYAIKIDARVKQDGFREDWLSSFLIRRFPLLKNKKIVFEIIKNNVPEPYDIKWKIRNFGEEAKSGGGLRGEISNDLGYEKKNEQTKYAGEHYAECYLIKNNVCVAIDRKLVPIGNNY